MTSISPAQPRPPSAFSRPATTRQPSFPTLPPSRASTSSRTISQDVLMTSPVDERPLKRRKVEDYDSPVFSEPTSYTSREEQDEAQRLSVRKYQRVDWTTALSVRPPGPDRTKSESGSLPPLPVPPWAIGRREELVPGRIRTSCRIRADLAVPNIPDSLQQPTGVPVLESKKPIDYFPWTGKHPEDIISETNVSKGYWDRAPQPLEKELNTAKAPLYNAFKHRAGLESLSALFSLVLDKKTKHGALSTSSTFRPPPRVTLTEAKRKSWISDLADENVPLRRLSRTIPQGVRGTALLEQCLLHNVPITRAIWFIKCVGANEIRTLKRKGANPTIVIGAEHKWLRDWTTNIEQFLENIVGQCGSQKWLAQLRYSLQLCARVYHENLLDRDHFLDWVVKSFSNSSLELLAVWLSFVQMWRIDLTRFRKRAKSLVVALLNKVQDLSRLGITNMLQEKLRKAIQSLVVFRPACFLMPDLWSSYRSTLQSCMNLSDIRENQIYEQLEKRNDRMLGKDLHNQVAAAKSVFEILDSCTVPFDVQQISQTLSKSCFDRDELSTLCLQWATSKFRGGISRIYLTARLLRRWLRDGFDIGNRILNFFSDDHKTFLVDSDSFRHLFAELSRSRSFSSSRFLQNLTLRSPYKTQSEADRGKPPTVLEGHLLQDLSLQDAEQHLINLRNHLLRDIGRSVLENEGLIPRLKYQLKQALEEADAENSPAARKHVDLLMSRQLDWSARFEISQWLRAEAGLLAQFTMVEIPGKPPLPGSKTLKLNQFLIIRDVLELFQDIAVLADVLSMLSRTKQENVLAAMVDTVQCNAAALSAIGALEPLQRLYGQAYIALRSIRPSLLSFATALTDLCQYFPCSITPIRALQQDLIRGDRGRALAACSPFSDGIAESLQQAGATFADDFEAILQGEPNMSEQTMTSLFSVLVGRIMKSDNESHDQSTSALCQLLARLRLFRPLQGDTLIKKWITRLFAAAWSQRHQCIILELVSTRCISIETLLSICEQAPPASSCRIALMELVASSLVPYKPFVENRQQMYVVRSAAKRLLVTNPSRMLEVLLTKADARTDTIQSLAVVLPRLLDNKPNLSTLSTATAKQLPTIVEDFLNISGGGHDVLRKLLSLSDWLSLPYLQYRLEMQAPGDAGDLYGVDVGRSGSLVLEALQSKFQADKVDIELTQAIMDAMPVEISAQVRALTEQQFYTTLSKASQLRNTSLPVHHTAEDGAKAMQVVERLVALGPAKFVHAVGDTNGMLIEKLTIIHKILGAKGDVTSSAAMSAVASSPMSPGPSSGQFSPVLDSKHLDTILAALDQMELISRVASMKASSFGSQVNTSNPASSKQVQLEQMKILALLASITTQPVIAVVLQSDIGLERKKRIQDCMSITLDVAARIADDLTEEARGQCAKILKEKVRDERISWLVGSMGAVAATQNAAGKGLIVMHETKGYMGEFRPKQWEMLENGGGKEGDTCLGLGLFGAKRLQH